MPSPAPVSGTNWSGLSRVSRPLPACPRAMAPVELLTTFPASWPLTKVPVAIHAEGDLPARAVADLFPAYDDDGGLLLVLTPSK